MKFNIYINQYKLSEYPEITIQDCAVIDWLYSMFGSSSVKIDKKRVEGWTWISLVHLIDDMPLLRLKTSSGASKMVNRIKNMGFIETKVDRKERKLFARPTKKIRDLYFSSQVPEARSQVLEDTSQVPQDLNHNTNIIILNPHIQAPPEPLPVDVEIKETRKEKRERKEREYTFSGYMDSLIHSSFKPNKILYLYFLHKKFQFENLGQWETAAKSSMAAASQLQGYNSKQIESTMDKCQEKWEDNWTLFAVVKQIPNVVNKR